ncbi:hypothetical protein GND95_10460 [Defluviitalea raffinosedens]|uniref:Uncharacterized protein n=1 Tax=Defluviitalea raffinosedens TaxID=1450156 RepID=A0A7C8LK09_9FIRM|nr:hypothetical protein [Defluviitalea raffinosedens]KAE9632937.1 hypothetical protein GND95_10460 [Defluviitalea raffinosedens]
MDRWELILGLGLAFVLVFAVIFIVLYVLKSIGIFGMAKKAGIENSWLAWIPVADMYIMGKLVGKIKLFNQEINKLEVVLPVVCAASIVLGGIPFIGFLISIAYVILNFASIYNLYKKYRGDKAVGMLILSIIFIFMCPIYLFTLRNADPIEGFGDNTNTVAM